MPVLTGAKHLHGHLAASGADPYREAHRRFGKRPWKELVQPAVDLATKGFEVSFDLAQSLRSVSRIFAPFPTSARIFTRDGQFYEWGERLVQPELGAALERIRDQGAGGFYGGETARLLAADMRANGGLITEEDLRIYKVSIREPLKGNYRGYEILTMPPPSRTTQVSAVIG